jgi:glycosyltransferase involved in cell wall biosynthesis
MSNGKAARESPAKVAFCGPHLHKPGGIATFCRAVYPALRFPAEYFARGAPAPSAPITARLVGPVGDYRAFGRLLEDQSYRVVHLNLSLSRVSVLRDRGFAAAAKRADRALVLAIHGWNQRFFEGAMNGRLGGVRGLLSAADKIFVVNRDARRSLETAGYGEQVEVVPSVLETSLVEGARLEELEAARSGPPVVLFLARLEASKGILQTIKAFEAAKRRHPDIELVVAGEGGAAAEAADYVRRRAVADVRFLGYVTGTRKKDAFRRASVYVLPTDHHEGMPHSLIEAMAFGLPVITCPAPGVRDFFADGEMGFLCGGDAESLATKMIDLLEDGRARRRIGEHNFAFARRAFSAASVSARFDEAYERLTGSSP